MAFGTSSEKNCPAVVLLSGGLDSATTLAIAVADGFSCHALTFDYGQRHRFELAAAARVAQALGAADHRVVKLDMSAAAGFGGSALTDEIPVPKGDPSQPPPSAGAAIPVTYVPARNTIFLAVALGYAEAAGAFDIFIGANAVDYSGYPDCRPEFLEAFERMANLATVASVSGKGTFHIQAPLVHLSKAQIIRRGLELGVNYGLTHSCYDPDPGGRPCGRCDSCRIRRAGFAAAGAKDPLAYP
jgi:7-cyano-7-deazaguanine synthase